MVKTVTAEAHVQHARLVGFAARREKPRREQVWPASVGVEGRAVAVRDRVPEPGNRPVPYSEIALLEQVEQDEAKKRGLEEFKFASNEEMIEAIENRKKD